jgi:hypothetical protein
VKGKLRKQEQQLLEKAAEYLYADYMTDKNLTIFTQLDCEIFYKYKKKSPKL